MISLIMGMIKSHGYSAMVIPLVYVLLSLQ